MLHLCDGQIVRKEVIKIIAIKGNQFYNCSGVIQKQDYRSINFDMEGAELIDMFSSYKQHEELYRICFMTVNPLENKENS